MFVYWGRGESGLRFRFVVGGVDFVGFRFLRFFIFYRVFFVGSLLVGVMFVGSKC